VRIPVRAEGSVAVPPSLDGRPDHAGLVDRFGRVARDLRVSVTEKCSLRCTYCMPADGLPAIPRESLLTATEIARLVGIGVRDLGIREVRFTGGEPLMRADLTDIVARSAAVAPGIDLSITTNGIGLDRRVGALVAAGLTRANISLDTVDRAHFATLTRRDRLPAVLAGIRAAHDAGLTPLKLNAVMMRDTLADAPELLAWALENGCRLRFIEQMPLDAGHTWDREQMVTREEIVATLSSRWDLTPVPGRGGAPAEKWVLEGVENGGGPHEVGVIASVTAPFCGDCDRLRLTADGQVRNCLFSIAEYDLVPVLRGGAPDRAAAIDAVLRASVRGKLPGHAINDPSFLQPPRGMNAIGG
jgi:cyclic pyranopterin phosphate synthase